MLLWCFCSFGGWSLWSAIGKSCLKIFSMCSTENIALNQHCEWTIPFKNYLLYCKWEWWHFHKYLLYNKFTKDHKALKILWFDILERVSAIHRMREAACQFPFHILWCFFLSPSGVTLHTLLPLEAPRSTLGRAEERETLSPNANV